MEEELHGSFSWTGDSCDKAIWWSYNSGFILSICVCIPVGKEKSCLCTATVMSQSERSYRGNTGWAVLKQEIQPVSPHPGNLCSNFQESFSHCSSVPPNIRRQEKMTPGTIQEMEGCVWMLSPSLCGGGGLQSCYGQSVLQPQVVHLSPIHVYSSKTWLAAPCPCWQHRPFQIQREELGCTQTRSFCQGKGRGRSRRADLVQELWLEAQGLSGGAASPEHPLAPAAAGTPPPGLWHRAWDRCSCAKTCRRGSALCPEIMRYMVCVSWKIHRTVAALLMVGAVRPGGRVCDGDRRCSGLLGYLSMTNSKKTLEIVSQPLQAKQSWVWKRWEGIGHLVWWNKVCGLKQEGSDCSCFLHGKSFTVFLVSLLNCAGMDARGSCESQAVPAHYADKCCVKTQNFILQKHTGNLVATEKKMLLIDQQRTCSQRCLPLCPHECKCPFCEEGNGRKLDIESKTIHLLSSVY